jgi:hypothetical protein
LKTEIFDLEFDSDFYFIQKDSIVDRVIFHNRTLYSKFKKIDTPLTPLLIKQHLNREVIIALPLIKNNFVNYIVLEYEREKNNHFFYLIKHLLKLLEIEHFYTYESSKKNFVQIFIPTTRLEIENAYNLAKEIEQVLKLKSSKRCKILPNRNLPIKYNKITLPIKKM